MTDWRKFKTNCIRIGFAHDKKRIHGSRAKIGAVNIISGILTTFTSLFHK